MLPGSTEVLWDCTLTGYNKDLPIYCLRRQYNSMGEKMVKCDLFEVNMGICIIIENFYYYVKMYYLWIYRFWGTFTDDNITW